MSQLRYFAATALIFGSLPVVPIAQARSGYTIEPGTSQCVISAEPENQRNPDLWFSQCVARLQLIDSGGVAYICHGQSWGTGSDAAARKPAEVIRCWRGGKDSLPRLKDSIYAFSKTEEDYFGIKGLQYGQQYQELNVFIQAINWKYDYFEVSARDGTLRHCILLSSGNCSATVKLADARPYDREEVEAFKREAHDAEKPR